MLPALSTVIALISRLEDIFVVNSAQYLAYFGLTITACIPWVSVINPLVVILFVERYRKYMARLFRGGGRTGTVNPQNNVLVQGPNGGLRRFETTGPPLDTTRV